jgi:VIT1/CCC1 family predicted Fe2+/Mn2+ transporter
VPAPPDRTEEEQEQLNRQLSELLQELRVAMPGVQVLFGFLLAAAFNERFEDLASWQEGVYLATLVCSALATAFFIAPTAYHRMRFQQGDRAWLIAWGTRLAVAGLAALALAMTGAVLVITSFIFDDLSAAIVTGAVAAVFAGLWFGYALSRSMRGTSPH